LSRRSRRVGHSLFTLTAFLLVGSMGCWEQWSDTWFPQMKRQKSIQAFEEVGFQEQIKAFQPPEGAVPVTPGIAPHAATDEVAANALANPRPMRRSRTGACSTSATARPATDRTASATARSA
jgi:hypothetical protein